MSFGLVFDIKRFALHDGPGIRTTVFLKGCPLRCWWCQNPESIREFPETIKVKSLSTSYNNSCVEETKFGKEYSVDDLFEELIKDRIFYEESNGGITFSGGEPLVQYKFLGEVLSKCKLEGLSTAIDTSGYAPFESIEYVYDNTDVFLYDIKLMDNELHKRFTDVPNEIILENLKRLTSIGNKVLIRIPLIPGITDIENNLLEIVKFLTSLDNIRQIDLLPYNKIAESKYKRFNKQSLLGNLETQSEERLLEIKSLFNSLDTKVSLRG
jgi:pyruvate formate lyase activating enzyme